MAGGALAVTLATAFLGISFHWITRRAVIYAGLERVFLGVGLAWYWVSRTSSGKNLAEAFIGEKFKHLDVIFKS